MKTRQFALVKYKYGWRCGRPNTAFTAFALTPMHPPRIVFLGEKQFTTTNEGDRSSRARHFQTATAAKAWAAQEGIEIVNQDWRPLRETTVWPPDWDDGKSFARTPSPHRPKREGATISVAVGVG